MEGSILDRQFSQICHSHETLLSPNTSCENPSPEHTSMALPLPLFLLGTRPVYVLVVSASVVVALAFVAVVLVTWQLAWILWYHNMSVRARRCRDTRALQLLARTKYDPGVNAKLAECAICLMEFVEGEAVRLLPRCGHGFHAECIDRWLDGHSSCPYCRGVVFRNVSIML